MDVHNLISTLRDHLGKEVVLFEGPAHCSTEDGECVIALCPGERSAEEHLVAFEQAMELLLEVSRSSSARLGLAVDVEAIGSGELPSYRKALKKYSRSIVFEDIDITLFLVFSNQVAQVLPQEVNSFLRNLDHNLRPS